MELLTLNHSSYPRIGNTPEEQILRLTIALRDRAEKTDADVRAAEDQMVMLALREQEEIGIDIVTDGLVRWNDPISHFAEKFEGVRIGGLLRFFDTNVYFRQPAFGGTIRRIRPLVADEFRWAAQRVQRSVKPVLTGPYTLTRLSLWEAGARCMESAVMSVAEAIGAEVAELAAAGAQLIQIDEPALVKYPPELHSAWAALKLVAAQKSRAELALALYFGDASPLYATLQDLAFDTLILDFTYSSRLPQVIESEGSIKQLGFGLSDGRNTRLEDQTTLLYQLEAMLRRVKPGHAYLTTSCGLEYLPRDRARLKLRQLTSLKRSFLGETG